MQVLHLNMQLILGAGGWYHFAPKPTYGLLAAIMRRR